MWYVGAPTMPLQPPPTKPAFIASVQPSVATWTSPGYFTEVRGGARLKCNSVNGSAWTLSTSGLLISETSAATLVGATANDDGSYTSATGASYNLEVVDGAATAVQVP